jgi:ubiquinone/menaquinone biosynthesis C-methylase UbiE
VNVLDDVAEHKDWLLSLVPAPNSGIWVDLGCGDGSDVRRLALRQPAAGLRVVGIDGNRKVIEEAQRNTGDDPRVEFQSYSLGRTLPFEDATVDVAYSNNLIECLADVSSFISEITRILRPGGFVVMAIGTGTPRYLTVVTRIAIVGSCMPFAIGSRIGWIMPTVGWDDGFGQLLIQPG